ncbi:MAG TPA: hypothetical protein GXX55_02640 [Firmicutes bacterium]|nr:hypothetical protein [Bacillota bacterium]
MHRSQNWAGGDERSRRIRAILDFVSDHRESLASLVICRRALGQGVDRVNNQLVNELGEHLRQAGDEEIASYYDIVL